MAVGSGGVAARRIISGHHAGKPPHLICKHNPLVKEGGEGRGGAGRGGQFPTRATAASISSFETIEVVKSSLSGSAFPCQWIVACRIPPLRLPPSQGPIKLQKRERVWEGGMANEIF